MMAITVHGNNSARYFLKLYKEQLANRYPETEAESIYRLVLADTLGWPYSATLMLENKRFSESEILKVLKALDKLVQGLPVQLVNGVTEFFDLQFAVNQHVLFPRPETEYLIHLIQKELKSPPKVVLDVCTGSGCIAIALKSLFPSAEVMALEKSTEALKVAQANSEALNLPVRFQETDVLSGQWPDIKVDVLVSNPPYIPYNELDEIDEHVWDHEPEMALMVPNEEPLLFYEAILKKAKQILNRNGHLFFEINPNYANELCSLGQDLGYKTKLILDIENKNRFLHCIWPPQ